MSCDLFGQLHHHHCRQACRLSPQSALAQVDGDEASTHGTTYLVNAEVALGAYKHQGIIRRLKLTEFIEKVHPRYFLITMGNIAMSSSVTGDKRLERGHVVDLWHISLMALLDGSNNNLADALELQVTPF